MTRAQLAAYVVTFSLCPAVIAHETSTPDTPPQVALTDIFRGVMPFLALIIFSMVVLYVYPQIAFFLPDYFYGAR